MKPLSQAALKKELITLEKKDLVSLICQLYGESKVVKDKLNVSLRGDDYIADLVADYCQKIHKVMFPRNIGRGGDYRAVKKLINEFKERCSDQEAQARVNLQFALDGTQYTEDFGDMSVPYYNAVLDAYQNVVDVAEGNETFFESIKQELRHIEQASQGIGWGFEEGVMDIFCQIAYKYDEED
ncbi:hypothetical protein AB6M97_07685 [Streptococcus hillyeri]|uniref:Uncharacterized protein n=1 Tax=Streptococcus hillyeri TaxID=2282420 RepID=A0A3L9DJQ9_9STRE|nr:hypothetical protein [Streptococcus hillyeri]RLY01205.1 hypothetical protein EAF07_10100 [Streptococcus hillyeri]